MHSLKKKIFTNCFLVKTDSNGVPTHICLAMKKRGFGQGMWNGSGGKPKDGEKIADAACREVEEEFKVKVKKYEKRGEITFILRKENKKVLMHTFLVTSWDNKPSETEEMKPKWFSVNKTPYRKMWASDREWLPIILSGKKIRAKYTYKTEGGKVETREVKEVVKFV
ncbi:8-oxo-dGTP diphosphatase [Patescibacteria group bacterium]